MIQVFEPYRKKLPPLKAYFREFWRRREFASQLSIYDDKAEYLDSKLGKVWLVVNPLFLAGIYFLLVSVIQGKSGNTGFATLCHILIGLFTFYFAQNCISIGAQSITRGSRLILNQAFPRMLLPYSSALSAVRQFLPTLPIYITIVVIGKFLFPSANLPGWHFNYLIIPIVLICLAATSFGLALFFATLNVYFRDTTKLLNYILRIWLYACPVLWLPEVLTGWHRAFLYINPLGPTLAANSRIWIEGSAPTAAQFVAMFAWAFFALLFGGYFFLTREREFAVRV